MPLSGVKKIEIYRTTNAFWNKNFECWAELFEFPATADEMAAIAPQACSVVLNLF